ncbi:hypothetical protein HY950_02590 [Candidatus Gottesmanbacteria bacterium]|nr:hypothetical protein [Candidatus Gottesmanbacteria bacterium]
MPTTPDRPKLGTCCSFYLAPPGYCLEHGKCAALDFIRNQKEAGGLSQAEKARMEKNTQRTAIGDGCTEIHPESDAPKP